jgi:hypothetical protein
MIYRVKVVKGSQTKGFKSKDPYICSGYTIIEAPESGPYADKLHLLGMAQGDKVKLILDTKVTIVIPKDGDKVYIEDETGKTIDSFPHKKKAEMRVLKEGE